MAEGAITFPSGRGRGRYGLRRADDPARTMPHSIDAEENLLSCCLLDGAETVSRCVEAHIRAESFYVAAHGIIFDHMRALLARRAPMEMSVVAEELKASKQLDVVGGYAFLSQVSARQPTTLQTGYFIDVVKKHALARAKIRRAGGIVEKLYEGDDEAVRREEAALKELESEESGFLPVVLSALALAAKKLIKPVELIAGVLHLGSLLLVAGGSKSFKTWVLLDAAIAVASGTGWWGFKTAGAKVLFVNFELPDWSIDDRIREICEARKIDRPAGLEIWNLRGFATDIDELLPYFEARGVRGQYGLIILDPIYVCLGARDENSNSDVTQLMNRLLKLTRVTGAAVGFGHHFSKGNQSEKEAKDRPSGASAWVRAPDAVITLAAHEEDEAFRVDFVLRNVKPRAPLVVRWAHPLMVEDAKLDPNALRQPGRPKEGRVEDVVKLIAAGGLTFGEWEKAATRGKAAISESTFKRRVREGVDRGLVVQNGPVYRQNFTGEKS